MDASIPFDEPAIANSNASSSFHNIYDELGGHHHTKLSTIIGPTIEYQQTKPSYVHSTSYSCDSRLCSTGAGSRSPSPSSKSPQMMIIEKHENIKRGRNSRRLMLWSKAEAKSSDEEDKCVDSMIDDHENLGYTTYYSRKLSPDSRRKHKEFWTQMDDDDEVPGADITDDDIDLPYDEASIFQSPVSRKSALKSKSSQIEEMDRTADSSFAGFLTNVSCGCVSGWDEDTGTTVKEVKIDPIPTVYDYNCNPKA